MHYDDMTERQQLEAEKYDAAEHADPDPTEEVDE
jgi:hypothetical protein